MREVVVRLGHWLFCPVICLLMLNSGVSAQTVRALESASDAIHQHPLQLIEINEGLSQGMINDLVVDSIGFLWIATKDGLNRYDGNHFKVYREVANDETSLSANFVNSLLVDSRGWLWAGTQTAGVNLFDPATDGFIRYSAGEESDKPALTFDFIGELYEDAAGNIVVQTLDEHGFNVLMTSDEPEDFRGAPEFQILPISEVYPVFNAMHRTSYHSRQLLFDAENGMWYVNQDTIFYSPPESLNDSVVPYVFALTASGLDKEDEYGVVASKDKKRVFTSDRNRRLYEFDFNQRKFRLVFVLPEEYRFRQEAFVDSDNRYWSWTEEGEGICISADDSTMVIYQPDWSRMLEGSNEMITGILCEDLNDNYWMGTGGNGFLEIVGKAGRFKQPIKRKSAIVGSIRSFRVERSGGVGYFEKSTAQKASDVIAQFEERTGKHWEDEIAHLAMEGDSAFWLRAYNATKDSVLVGRYALSRPSEFKVIAKRRLVSAELFGNPIFFDSDDNVWFSERGVGDAVHLYKFDQQQDSLYEYEVPAKGGKFQYRFISDWQFDKQGKLWLSTMEGVFCFDEDNESWLHLAESDADINGLSENQTLTVCLDPFEPEKIVWVGTEGGGLNKVNIETGKVQVFKSDQGLPNDVVYGVLPDSKGNLWFGTNSGLCHMRHDDYKIRVYTMDDGLPSNEFNRYEFSQTREGELCFGTMGGVVLIDPKDFYVRAKTSQTLITELYLFNELVEFRDKEAQEEHQLELQGPIIHAKHLELDHFHDMLTFRFAHLDLTSAAKNRFKYRLLGLNDQWIETDGRNEATFTNLAKGNYTLEVMGAGSDFEWNPQPTRLNITVNGPWWSSIWFKLFILLAVVALLYTLYKVRVNNLLQFERMRNRIAQDLHDEIGSTLSSIALYSSVLEQQSAQMPPQAESVIKKIGDAATTTMESMNDIVWSINAENKDLGEVIARIRAYAISITETTSIQLKIESGKELELAEVDAEHRKNLYLITKEAISNAVRHADCSVITVHFKLEQRWIHVRISDDGKGFEKNQAMNDPMNLGGNGLKSMANRARELGSALEITSEIGRGTELRFKCPVKR
jgi:ligand-binding sensor domain-containing protein/two-component sensor histidine kinase